LAEVAVRQLQLDRLHIMPTGQAWHKARVLSSAAHRVAMCQAAFGGLPQVTIDTREIQRAGPSYTADTLRELAAEYPAPTCFWCWGPTSCWPSSPGALAGGAGTSHAWRSPTGRSIWAPTPPPTRLPKRPEGVDLPFVPLDMPLHDTSSTAIRAHVHGQSRRYPDLDVLVPEGVARYISEHHLYELPT
jgi:nicotinate-nucleotide adenylyltransferase